MKTRSLVALAIILSAILPLTAADWPQWRGPKRDNVSTETGLLKTWPSGGPKLLWTGPDIGLGYSGPAVSGERLYILGTRDQREHAFALDPNTGKEVWAAAIGPIFQFKGNNWGDGPRSTPTVDGAYLYALGGQGELVCLETATGKKVWGRNLLKEFNGNVMDNNGPKRTGWGYTEGPLVDGGQVVCTPGGEDGTLLALDKKTGKEIWRTREIKDKAPYSSIVAADVGGVHQYVQMTDKAVVGVAAKDGKLLWRYEQEAGDVVVRTPIVHDNRVFATEGYTFGSYLIELTPAENAIKAEKVYSNKNMKNEMGGVVLVNDHLYGYSDNKGWICQEFTKKKGAIVWDEKRKLGKGSVTYVEGHLYCFTEEDGIVALVEAKPTKWKEDGRFKIPRESARKATAGKIWTAPVVANGKLYLRDQELLFCYDVKAR